jgi:hypothetical protein
MKDVTYRYSGLFTNFTLRTGFHRLTEFQMTAWKLPGILTVFTDPFTQQKPVTVPYHDANTDMRPFAHLSRK